MFLRALTEAGDVWDDPSEDLMYELLSDLPGVGDWVIVERPSDSTGQTYAQVLANRDGTFLIEYREGGPERHYQAIALDMRTVHAALSGWAFELDGWRDPLEWHELKVP